MDEETLIITMREAMVCKLQNVTSNEVSAMDVDLIKSSKDLLRRFALHEIELNKQVRDKSDLSSVNVDKACNLLLSTLKWRSKFAIHDIKDSDFPREFYQMDLFSYALHRKEKVLMIFVRASKYRPISSDTRDLFIRGIIHEVEKRIKQYEKEYPRGIADLRTIITLDATDIGYNNIDIQLIISIISIVNYHFPSIVESIYLYAIPWFARYLVPIIIKAIPEYIGSKVKAVSKGEAVKLIGHLLPERMGGDSSIKPCLEVPSTTLYFKEWVKKCHLSPSDQKKMRDYVNSEIIQP